MGAIVFQIKIWAGVQTLVWKNQNKSWTPSQNIFLENYGRIFPDSIYARTDYSIPNSGDG